MNLLYTRKLTHCKSIKIQKIKTNLHQASLSQSISEHFSFVSQLISFFSLSILRVTALEQIVISQELQDPKGNPC